MSTPEERLEWARVRALMMRPGAAWLVTVDGHRWLTDSYTLLNVTDSRALWTDERHESEIPDGHYRVTAGQGLVASGAAELVAPDVAGLLRVITSGDATNHECSSWPDSTRWLPVEPTLWTVAESGAKAMVVYAEGEVDHIDPDDDCLEGDCPCLPRRYPLLINEEVWTAYHDYYDRNKNETRRAVFEKDPARKAQPFRIMLVTTYDVGGEEVETAELLAYVMGARIPPGTWGTGDAGYGAAQYIVDAA